MLVNILSFRYFVNYRGACLLRNIEANDVIPKKQVQFNFQPLDIPLGVYFEKILTIRFFKDQWHIVYHIDLKLTDTCTSMGSQLNFEKDTDLFELILAAILGISGLCLVIILLMLHKCTKNQEQ